MLASKKNPIVDLYNENFSDIDEMQAPRNDLNCKIDGDINLFNRMPTEQESVEKDKTVLIPGFMMK